MLLAATLCLASFCPSWQHPQIPEASSCSLVLTTRQRGACHAACSDPLSGPILPFLAVSPDPGEQEQGFSSSRVLAASFPMLAWLLQGRVRLPAAPATQILAPTSVLQFKSRSASTTHLSWGLPQALRNICIY